MLSKHKQNHGAFVPAFPVDEGSNYDDFHMLSNLLIIF